MSIYQFSASKNGNALSLDQYRDKVLLIVNTASRCGFTPQYKSLQALYEKHRDAGFEVLAFPCNQFGAQEPGSDQEIQSFCDLNYQISFPVFDKIDVNGDSAHPLYQYLKGAKPGLLSTEAIKWNFTKFLVNGKGEPVKRYGSNTKPEQIEDDIEALL